MGVLGRLRVWVVGGAIWVAVIVVVPINLNGDARRSGVVWCRQVGALTALFLIVAIVRVLWPMRTTKGNPLTLVGGGRTYAVNSFTGTVNSASKALLSTTTVEGRISTGVMNDVTGTISSRTQTSVHDQFFLTNSSGLQHGVQVRDAHVPVGDGQLVTAAWAIARGSKTGPYVLFVNHSTGVTTFAPRGMYKVIFGGRIGWHVVWAMATGALLTVGGYTAGIVLMFVGLFAFAFVSRLQARAFRAVTSRPLVAALTQQGAVAAVALRPAPTMPVTSPPPPPVQPLPPTAPPQLAGRPARAARASVLGRHPLV